VITALSTDLYSVEGWKVGGIQCRAWRIDSRRYLFQTILTYARSRRLDGYSQKSHLAQLFTRLRCEVCEDLRFTPMNNCGPPIRLSLLAGSSGCEVGINRTSRSKSLGYIESLVGKPMPLRSRARRPDLAEAAHQTPDHATRRQNRHTGILGAS